MYLNKKYYFENSIAPNELAVILENSVYTMFTL